MSDPIAPVAGAKVIRIDQWIKRRQRAVCEHIEVVVDDNQELLECATCGGKVDPYYWIRKLAERAEEWEASWQAVADEKTAEINEQIHRHNMMVEDRNNLISKLTRQVNQLRERKERLEIEIAALSSARSNKTRTPR